MPDGVWSSGTLCDIGLSLLCWSGIVIDVSHGSAVNLCVLDITKAFDRLNHDGLFINLMRRFIPATLLNVLEKWLGIYVLHLRQLEFRLFAYV